MLCTACSSPEAQLWLKVLISLLLALFSFSIKTCLESAFYSAKYTCMCHPSHTSDVALRSSKDMLVILMNNWLERSLAVLIVRCSWVNAKTKALLNVSENLVKSLALSTGVSALKWNLKEALERNGFWLPFVVCLSASLIEHSFVKSAVGFAICQSVAARRSLSPLKHQFRVLINHRHRLVRIEGDQFFKWRGTRRWSQGNTLWAIFLTTRREGESQRYFFLSWTIDNSPLRIQLPAKCSEMILFGKLSMVCIERAVRGNHSSGSSRRNERRKPEG